MKLTKFHQFDVFHPFLDPLKSQERLECNQGDIGFAGGIQIMEPASLGDLGARSRFGVASFPMEKTWIRNIVYYI